MAEWIGVKPSFDPNSLEHRIKHRFARTWVRAAFYRASREKKPPEAIKECIKKLDGLDPEIIETKYLREGAIEETRKELERLAGDLSDAGNYWSKIFAYVTKKYFKDREKDILKELGNSRWYPYLEIVAEETAGDAPISRNVRPLSGCLIIYALPTDVRQRERFDRYVAKGKVLHPFGWIYLRENFGLLKGASCLVIDNVQRPKISGSADYAIAAIFDLPAVISAFCNNNKNNRDRTIRGLCTRFKALSEGIDAANFEGARGQMRVIMAYNSVKKMLLEAPRSFKRMADVPGRDVPSLIEELGLLSDALKKWEQGLPAELKEKIGLSERQLSLYGPQSLYALDFLPAFLASIYFLEKNCTQRMQEATAIVIDKSLAAAPRISLFAPKRDRPKELEDYERLIKVLGAREIAENQHFVRFSR